MWNAPEPPHEPGQVAWWHVHPAPEWAFENGKTPGWTVWDIEHQWLEVREGRKFEGERPATRDYRANRPEEADGYWRIIASHPASFTDDPDSLARHAAYIAEHEAKVSAAAGRGRIENAKSGVTFYLLLAVFLAISLLYGLSSCSWNSPLNQMM